MKKLSNCKKFSSKSKRFAILILTVLLFLCSVALCSCVSNKTFTVTFIQGDKTSTRVVNRGQNVTNLPFLEQKRGYTVTWDKTNLMNVQSNVTVYAIETPNTYTITYYLGEVSSAQITASTQKVTFDAEFTLYKPSATGYTFVTWKIKDTEEEFANGIYTLDYDISLVAVWNPITQPCTVTFVQGDSVIAMRVVNKGDSVTDLPDSQPKRGYTVTWDNTDLSNIQADLTVRAIETPNTYKITYSLGNVTSAQITATTQNVTFAEAFSLYKPTAKGYTFKKWVIKDTNEEFTSGTYNLDADVELIAVWEKLDWSDFH